MHLRDKIPPTPDLFEMDDGIASFYTHWFPRTTKFVRENVFSLVYWVANGAGGWVS